MAKKIVKKSGAWYSYGGERVGQGRLKAKAFLRRNKDVRSKIERAVREAMGLPVPGSGGQSANGTKAKAR